MSYDDDDDDDDSSSGVATSVSELLYPCYFTSHRHRDTHTERHTSHVTTLLTGSQSTQREPVTTSQSTTTRPSVTLTSATTLSILHRFATFFHCCKQH